MPQEGFSGSGFRGASQCFFSQVASGRLPGLERVWRGRSCLGRCLGRSRDSWKVPGRVPGKVLGDVACYRICATRDMVCATRFFTSGFRKLLWKCFQEGFLRNGFRRVSQLASGWLPRKWLQDGLPGNGSRMEWAQKRFLRSGFRWASQEVSRSCFRSFTRSGFRKAFQEAASGGLPRKWP